MRAAGLAAAALVMVIAPAGAAPVGAVAPLDRVVARVGDVVIWESELDARAATDPAAPRGEALEALIDEELLVAEARRERITVGASELEAALDEIKQQNRLDDAGLAAVLKEHGYTRARYRAELQRQLLRLRLYNAIIVDKVVVTDAEIAAEARQRGLKVPPSQQDAEQVRSELRRKRGDAAVAKRLVELRKRARIERRLEPRKP